MTETAFHLIADVSSDNPAAIVSLLEDLIDGSVTETAEGFHVDGWMRGADAASSTGFSCPHYVASSGGRRLRAEWTTNGETERFFDYVPKGTRPASPTLSDPEG